MAKSRNRKKKLNKAANNIPSEKTIIPWATMQRPEINSRIQWTIIPEFPLNDYRAKITRTQQGSHSIYQVNFVFAVPGKDVFKDKLDFRSLMKSGDSLLRVTPGVKFLKSSIFNEVESVEILYSTNSNNRISGAQMRIDAQDFLDAERFAYDLIMPQISFWSFSYNISIDLAGYEVIEENTQSKKYNFGALGKIRLFNDNHETVASFPEYRKFYAAFREGMNATNVFYQALSFYKVTEGIIAERKREQRRTKNDIPTYVNETVPNNIDDIKPIDSLVKLAFKPYTGQSFIMILDSFRELIRNAIAHLSQLDGALNSDKFDDFVTCDKAVPVLHYIARVMLTNELEIDKK